MSLQFVFFPFLLAISLTISTAVAQGDSEIEEVVVAAEYIPDEKLATAQIADVLDASDIAITGDGNVGEALKRLPGLSLVDGSKLFVRGLGERYSSVYFNGAILPGITPLSRAVPLDLFDPSVTSNILVEKTYSSRFGAEFSGGAVGIRSAAVPNENFFELKASTAYNDFSTGKKARGYRGGDTDFLGIDDGTRDAPSLATRLFNVNPDGTTPNSGDFDPITADSIRFSFDNNWDSVHTTNEQDLGLSFAAGRRIEVSERVSVGLLGNGSWSRQFRNRFRESTNWKEGLASFTIPNSILQAGGGERARDDLVQFGASEVTDPQSPLFGQIPSVAADVVDDDRFREEIGLNGFFTVGVDIDNQHEIKLTKMILRLTTDDVTQTRRRDNDDPGTAVEEEEFVFAENEIDFQQISSTHIFDFGELSLRYADITGSRNSPDSRFSGRVSDVLGTQGLVSATIPNQFTADPGDDFTFVRRTDLGRLQTRNAASSISAGALAPRRSYDSLDDSGRNLGADLKLNFTSDRQFFSEFVMRTGFDYSKKSREFISRGVSYQFLNLGFSEDELSGPLSVLLDPSTCVIGAGEPGHVPNDINDQCFLAENFGGIGASDANPIPLEISARSTAENDALTDDIVDFFTNQVAPGNQLLQDFRFTNYFNNLTPAISADALTAITLTSGGDGADFRGSQVNEGIYIELDAEVLESLRFNIGARKERYRIDGSANVSGLDPIPSALSDEGLFPAFSATWKFYRNMQLRLAYSETRNRPILRELLAQTFLDPETGRRIIGNPDLVVAELENFDVRYEWYFGDNDYLSVSAFKKNIDNPIISTQDDGGGFTLFSFENRSRAVNEGLELELEKHLGESWVLSGNAAHISSRVPVEDGLEDLFGALLPLPGVSRELYNAQVVYKPRWGSVSLAWNKFTRRIDTFVVPDLGRAGVPTYEKGRSALDLNIKAEFEITYQSFQLGFKATNLLGEDFESVFFNGLPFENYERGKTYSLSIGWKDS